MVAETKLSKLVFSVWALIKDLELEEQLYILEAVVKLAERPQNVVALSANRDKDISSYLPNVVHASFTNKGKIKYNNKLPRTLSSEQKSWAILKAAKFLNNSNQRAEILDTAIDLIKERGWFKCNRKALDNTIQQLLHSSRPKLKYTETDKGSHRGIELTPIGKYSIEKLDNCLKAKCRSTCSNKK